MLFLCLLLAAACGYDYRKNRIPNYLVVLTAVLGAGWRLQNGGGSGLLGYMGQVLLIMLLLYPLFKIGTIGAGDVKLLGVTAGYLPCKKILIFLFFSLLIAAIISLIKMWKKNYCRERVLHLLKYLSKVWKSGKWQLYLEAEEDKSTVSICLAGPILFSILLYLGGVY